MTEQEELELIKKNSPYALPDNPAESGWSTAQIKEKFYAGLLVIYNLFKESRTSQNSNITNITNLVNLINEQYEGIINNETLKVRYDSESNEIVTTYAKIVDLVNGKVAALKYLKSDGTTKEFIYKIEQDLTTLTNNFNLVKQWADNLKSVNSQESVQRAIRATQDDLGNIIRNTYATVSSLNSLTTTVTNIINGTLIVDKASKDANGKNIANTYATKLENALKVAYTDIVNALNDTSTNKPLSAAKGKELQDQITAIRTLLESNDTDLDQLQEIVEYIKNNKSLIDGITTNKINYTDIVDNLTSQISNKPLSANQGYALKGMIDMLHQTIAPDTTDIYDLGTPTKMYKDIYFKGDLKDGTNSISVAALAQAMIDILNLKNDTPSNLALLKTYTQSNTDLADSVSKKHSHSNKNLLDTYNQTNDNIADAVEKKHAHTNKAVLDNISAETVANWNDKYSQAQTDSKVANAVNIAKGKTASYVIDLADNPSFNSTSDSITLSDSLVLTCVDGTTITLGDLKDGDNILITDVNVPDRWVAQITTSGQTKVYMMAALETRVVDLTPYAAVDPTSTANSGDVLLYNSNTHKMEKCPNGTYIIKNGKLSALVTDEISDTDQNNKFVTATEKSNISKSLYHLGAFDSADGKTRQTWVVDVKTLSFAKNTNGANHYRYTATLNINIDNGAFVDYVISKYQVASNTYEATSGFKSQIYDKVLYIFDEDFDNASATAEQFEAYFKASIQLQYKLAIPYTDDGIIENESILPLDSNMANKIRQKVVDGLNLIDNSLKQKNKAINSGSGMFISLDGYYGIEEYISIKPNTTYTKSTGFAMYFYDSNKAFLGSTATKGYDVTTFTTDSNAYYFRIDTNSDINLMLNSGNHLYPYSDFNQKEHITNDEATLLKQEEEKCRNLCKIVGQTSNNVLFENLNGTYSLSFNIVNASGTSVLLYSSNEHANIEFITSQVGYVEVHFTVANDNITIVVNGNTISSIMLNEGSEAKPYQEWNGEIVHKADIEPVLLWENPNPTYTLFANQTVNVKDMSKYKYIVFKFKQDYEYDAKLNIIQKVDYQTGAGFTVSIISQDTTVTYLLSRYTIIKNSTQVEFRDCIRDKTVDNAYITPIAIYGTNIL